MNIERTKIGLVRALLKPINTSAVIILGVYTILWGVWVGNPLWQVFGHSTIFSSMVFLPEFVWGAIAIALGSVTVYGVLKPSYKNLVRGALSLFFQWLMIGIFYLSSDWHSPAWLTAFTLTVYAGYVWLNLRVNKNTYQWTDEEADNSLKSHFDGDNLH